MPKKIQRQSVYPFLNRNPQKRGVELNNPHTLKPDPFKVQLSSKFKNRQQTTTPSCRCFSYQSPSAPDSCSLGTQLISLSPKQKYQLFCTEFNINEDDLKQNINVFLQQSIQAGNIAALSDTDLDALVETIFSLGFGKGDSESMTYWNPSAIQYMALKIMPINDIKNQFLLMAHKPDICSHPLYDRAVRYLKEQFSEDASAFFEHANIIVNCLDVKTGFESDTFTQSLNVLLSQYNQTGQELVRNEITRSVELFKEHNRAEPSDIKTKLNKLSACLADVKSFNVQLATSLTKLTIAEHLICEITNYFRCKIKDFLPGTGVHQHIFALNDLQRNGLDSNQPQIVSDGDHFTVYIPSHNGAFTPHAIPGDGACLFHAALYIKQLKAVAS